MGKEGGLVVTKVGRPVAWETGAGATKVGDWAVEALGEEAVVERVQAGVPDWEVAVRAPVGSALGVVDNKVAQAEVARAVAARGAVARAAARMAATTGAAATVAAREAGKAEEPRVGRMVTAEKVAETAEVQRAVAMVVVTKVAMKVLAARDAVKMVVVAHNKRGSQRSR